jgi:hypothetical protein
VLEVADPPLAAGAPLDQPPESAGVLGGLAGSARLALAGDRHLLHASPVQILVDCGLAVAAVGGHRLGGRPALAAMRLTAGASRGASAGLPISTW